jgi:hypothetical protein
VIHGTILFRPVATGIPFSASLADISVLPDSFYETIRLAPRTLHNPNIFAKAAMLRSKLIACF